MKTLVFFVSLLTCVPLFYSKDIKFDQDLVSVRFAPLILPGLDSLFEILHQKNLFRIINLMSTRFSSIYVPDVRINQETLGHLVLKAIAQFNKHELAPRQRPVEAIMSDSLFIGGNLETNVKILERLWCNEANSVYNGTVKAIILTIPTEFSASPNISKFRESLTTVNNIFKNTGKFTYKLGISLAVENCLNKTQLFHEVLNHADFVNIFVRDNVSAQVKTTSTDYNHMFIRTMESCRQQFTNETRNKHVSLRFSTGRSDTLVNTTRSISDLVNFWEMINDWAVKEKTEIILMNAFDNFKIETGKPDGWGWWRAKYGVSGSLLKFGFEEKAALLEMPEKRQTYSKNFDRDRFIVRFEPWVNSYDVLEGGVRAYNFSALLNMISQISRRFSKVILPSTSLIKYDEQNSETWIPSAVAEWNKNYRPTNSSPLEVRVSFELDLPKINTSQFTSFDVAKLTADDANRIFPGTVKVLVFHSSGYMNDVIAQMAYAKRRLLGAKFPYKLGVVFALNLRQFRLTFIQDFSSFLKELDEIILFGMPTDAQLKAGVDVSFPEVFIEFERCLVEMRKKISSISTGFLTWWPDTNAQGVENSSALVEYWRRANHWAVALNTNVILWEAFDNVKSPGRGNSRGWWKLDQSREYNDPSEYIFLEKAQDMEEEDSTSSKEKISIEFVTTSGYSVPTIVVFGLMTGLAAIALVSVPLVIIYRKKGNKFKEQYLTKLELNEFFDGVSTSFHENDQLSLDVCGSAPYNVDLEIALESFNIDDNGFLGMGAFGAVFRATVKIHEEREAAVKMTSPSAPATALKGLLSEIKILACVGQHENIVGLVGAYTLELSRGKLYVFLELCSNGCLKSYLRDIGSVIQQQVNTKKRVKVDQQDQTSAQVEIYENSIINVNYQSDQNYCNNLPAISSPGGSKDVEVCYENCMNLISQDLASDMHKWSLEIASGMEYLAFKKVVHGDLATRNVLLTGDKTAKISDFGLSRKLYEYANYVKQQQEPLPWRWMAPESLQRLEFGEKTDVWAFGITLWEIYSLGTVPYPGLSWSVDHPTMLEKGLKPDQPIYGNMEIYNAMLKCWEIYPEKRPSFSQLRNILHSVRKDELL